MKTPPFHKLPLAASIVLLLKSVTPAYAQATYYWDNNGTSTTQGGFGNAMAAGSTWAVPTTATSTVGWSTSATGNAAPVTTTTTTSDTLNFNSNGTITVLGTVAAGTINFNASALTVTGGTINLAASATISAGQPVTIASALSGAGTQLTKSGSNTLTLSGNNSYTGVTNITAGGIQFAKTQALYGGNTSNWTAANIKAANISTLSFNVGGTGEFSTSDITTLITNLGGDVTTGGMRSGSRWGFDPTNASGGNFTVASVIANTTGTGGGAIGLIKYGSNKLTLSGLNTFTGSVTVENGTLSVNTISPGSNAQSLGTNSVVNLGGSTGSTGVLEFTGSMSTTDKQIMIGRVNSSGQVGNASVLNNGTGSLTFTNAAFNAFVTGQGTAARTLTLGGNYSGGANEIQGIIRNNVSGGAGVVDVAVSGSHWKLSGANSYTGTTTVSAGTMEIGSTGTINTSSGVTIASGAEFKYNSSTALTVGVTNNGGTISGTGTISVDLALNSISDIIAPGNSPGIQPYSVNQTWSSFTYEWETNNFTGTTAGTDFDQIAITGNLNLTGAAPGSYILDLISLTAGNLAGNVPNFSETQRSWNILTTTGSISGFDASYWTIDTAGLTAFTSNPNWSGSWSLNTSGGNTLVLNYNAIPEPGAALLGGIGALLLLRRRRNA